MKRVHIILSGRVQGVNFRNYARQEAEKYEVTGSVRNLRDGTVEIIGEGEDLKLNDFVKACKKGPFLAFVEKADVAFEAPTGEFEEFEVYP
jgi:acylphosphatase